MRSSDIAYEKLRLMITTAELKPGQVLVEAELVQQLGLGRTPIREALNRLNWEQFVRIIPHQCIMVSELPLHELENIFQMRYTLSSLEGQAAALKRTEAELAALRQLVTQIQTESDPGRRVLLDRKLHDTISEMTRNSFLARQMSVLLDLSTRLLFINREQLDSIDNATIGEYEAIIDCLERQDGPATVEHLQRHVQDFHNKFLGRPI